MTGVSKMLTMMKIDLMLVRGVEIERRRSRCGCTRFVLYLQCISLVVVFALYLRCISFAFEIYLCI